MNKETLISVEQVSRYYGDHCAVDNISFTINRGEVLGFLGPNGAGKTTTMQMISGVLTATEGAISVAGHNINESARSAKKHIGFLPEQPPLYQDLKVDEYLNYAGRLRNIDRGKLKDAVQHSKSRCGLIDIGHRLIKNLSRGYQQRVGIAQAIIHSPSVVILDEPTSGLDPIQIREIRKLIRELSQDHSVILSTHILPEVQTTCDRVLIINNGKLVFDQSLTELDQNASNMMRVSFKRPPSLETIKQINGIIDAEQLDENSFLIRIDMASDSIDKILQKSLHSCWGLTEISTQSNSLEELFLQLTASEPIPKNITTTDSD